MPRAEHSQDIGELFRQEVEAILVPLKYEVLDSKRAIRCCDEYHGPNEHTIDIVARHVHVDDGFEKKIIVIESKKRLPSVSGVEHMVRDLANKIDCLNRVCRKEFGFSEVTEGLVVSDHDAGINIIEEFKRASREIGSRREQSMSLICGTKFRVIDGLSRFVRQIASQPSTTLVEAGKDPSQDIGSPCPCNIDQAKKFYLCKMRMKPVELRLSVFKLAGESYSSQDYLYERRWLREHNAVLEQIHSVRGFTNDFLAAARSLDQRPGLIDHYLGKTYYTSYLGYHYVNP